MEQPLWLDVLGGRVRFLIFWMGVQVITATGLCLWTTFFNRVKMGAVIEASAYCKLQFTLEEMNQTAGRRLPSVAPLKRPGSLSQIKKALFDPYGVYMI